LGLGAEITAATGMHAMAHLIESLTSTLPNRFCDILGREAISNIAKYLPIACEDGQNSEAREALSFAATTATICVRGGFIHIPHGFGENMVSVWDIPHGVAVANFLPETMRFLAPVIPERIAHVARSLGAAVSAEADAQQIGDLCAQTLINLLDEIKIPPFSKYIKHNSDMIDNIDAMIGTGELLHYSPRPIDREEAKAFVLRAYDSRD